jgi:hypothetical protein
MDREFPTIPFERYADDVICHCRSKEQASYLRDAIAKRFSDCYLELHPQKTKTAYCKNARRRGTSPPFNSTFLAIRFSPDGVEQKKERSLSALLRRSVRSLPKLFVRQCAAGRSTTEAISRLRTSPAGLTRRFEAGSTTTEATEDRLCNGFLMLSMPFLYAGQCENTKIQRPTRPLVAGAGMGAMCSGTPTATLCALGHAAE